MVTTRDDRSDLAVLSRALRDLIVAGDQLRRVIAAQAGLGLSEFLTLSQLYFGGPCGPGELATSHGLTPGTMTSLLDNLDSLGLVRRSAHPTDRRRQVVSLTEAGYTAHSAAFQRLVDAVAEAFQDQEDLDVATLSRFLEATVRAIRSHAGAIS